MRANVVDLVRDIAAVPGVRVPSMTTNGVLLGKLAEPLKEAGLQRVNVSMDTLDPASFTPDALGQLDDVWEGIEAAEAAGWTPISSMRSSCAGYNEEDVVDLAAADTHNPGRCALSR